MALYCQQWSICKEEDGVKTYLPLDCHSWSCPRCAAGMKSKITKALQDVEVHRFVTLTASVAAFPNPDDAWRVLGRSVNVLLKRIRRYCAPNSVEFFMVWETTQRGYPHAHLLFRGPYLPQRWLSRQWDDLTGSPIVDVRRVASGPTAAKYIAKYLAKQLNAPKGTRRYRHSFNFFGGPSLTSLIRRVTLGGWRVEKRSLGEIAREYSFAGWHVRNPRDGPLTVARVCPPRCICGYQYQAPAA